MKASKDKHFCQCYMEQLAARELILIKNPFTASTWLDTYIALISFNDTT
jgi:hypothetical protein